MEVCTKFGGDRSGGLLVNEGHGYIHSKVKGKI